MDLDAQNQRTKIQLENTASQESEADPSEYLKKLNGATPAPADIEGLVKI